MASLEFLPFDACVPSLIAEESCSLLTLIPFFSSALNNLTTGLLPASAFADSSSSRAPANLPFMVSNFLLLSLFRICAVSRVCLASSKSFSAVSTSCFERSNSPVNFSVSDSSAATCRVAAGTFCVSASYCSGVVPCSRKAVPRDLPTISGDVPFRCGCASTPSITWLSSPAVQAKEKIVVTCTSSSSPIVSRPVPRRVAKRRRGSPPVGTPLARDGVVDEK